MDEEGYPTLDFIVNEIRSKSVPQGAEVARQTTTERLSDMVRATYARNTQPEVLRLGIDTLRFHPTLFMQIVRLFSVRGDTLTVSTLWGMHHYTSDPSSAAGRELERTLLRDDYGCVLEILRNEEPMASENEIAVHRGVEVFFT